MGDYLGYIRVSRVGDRTETLISPKLQEEAIRKWGSIEGHQVDILRPELDASGGDDTRPILLSGIEAIERGEYDGLVVWKADRFTRSLRHSLELLERIEGSGHHFRSASEQMDPTTPAGRMQRNIMFAVAQNVREVQAESFQAAKVDAIERGIYIAPVIPLGYRKRKDRRLEPDPKSAPVVREVFTRRVAGANHNQLAQFIRDRLNRPFLAASVRSLLKNPAYLGVSRQGAIQNLNAHEPLIDRATWEAAQTFQPRPRRSSGYEALLRGHIFCCGCSMRMTVKSGRGTTYYACRKNHASGRCPEPASIRTLVLEGAVTELVMSHLDHLAAEATGKTGRTDLAEANLQAAEAELAAFQEITSITTEGAEFFQTGMRTRIAAVNAAREHLANVKQQVVSVPDPSAIGEIWDDLSISERRQFLGGAIGGVWVARGGDWAVVSPDHRPDRPRRGGPVRPLVNVKLADIPGQIGSSGTENR